MKCSNFLPTKNTILTLTLMKPLITELAKILILSSVSLRDKSAVKPQPTLRDKSYSSRHVIT